MTLEERLDVVEDELRDARGDVKEVARETTQLARAVQEVASAVTEMRTREVPALRTDVAVMQAERRAGRLAGPLATVIVTVASGMLLTVTGTAIMLWSDVRVLIKDYGELRKAVRLIEERQQPYTGQQRGQPPRPRAEHDAEEVR